MLTVDDYGRIRRAHRDNMSPHVHREAVARTFHHSRRKVGEALACPEPRSYTRAKDPPAPKLGSIKPVIEEILKADEQAPRKQRRTAAEIARGKGAFTIFAVVDVLTWPSSKLPHAGDRTEANEKAAKLLALAA